MRWIACVNQPFQGVIKHRTLKQLEKSFQFGTLVITDFHSVKLLSLKEFQSFPDYVPEFFRDKPTYALAIDRGGDISYSTDAGVSLVTDFFVDDFSARWRDEIHYIEDLKKVSSEFEFATSLDKSQVQVVTVKGNHFGFCRKHPAPLNYGRINKQSYILTDSNEIIYGPEITKVYVNTSPTLVNLTDFTYSYFETN